MNSSEYNQLLANVMLMPFTDIGLNGDDIFRDYVKAYSELVCGSKYSGEPRHKNAKDDLNKAKKRLLSRFADEPRWNHIDDVQMLCDMFFPGYKLMKFYNESNGDLGKFYLNHIYEVARTFITFRDGVVSVRSWADSEERLLSNYNGLHKIELWNYITRTMPPDLFIAATYINFGVKNIDMLIDVPNLVSLADIPLSKILKKGVAETHLHMNVGFSYSFVWKCCVDLFDCEQKTQELWFCSLFRIISSIFIEEPSKRGGNFQSFVANISSHFDNNALLDYYIHFIAGQKTKCLTLEQISEFKSILRKQYGSEDRNTNDILYDTVYHRYSESGTSSEIIWYFKILDFLKNSYDEELCRQFLMYIRYKSDYFKDKIQQNKIGGLDYFQNFYHSAANFLFDPNRNINEVRDEAYYSIFEEQCRNGNLDVLEIKISPRIISSAKTTTTGIDEMKRKSLVQIKQIVKAYSRYIRTTFDRRLHDKGLHFPKLGIMYHFIKQNDSDNFSGYNCILNEDAKNLDCMDYRTMRELNLRFAEAFRQLMEEYPLLTKYVVGIDAASVENSAEPWVFAPIFREFRPNNYILPVSSESHERVKNIGFTYHVGEDFRHIASGLRHIDEVLDHFNYCSGDRLGHAIALGVDIDRLMAQNRTVMIPIMEHLENLLWIWSKRDSSATLKVPQNIEYTIMDTARKIYHNTDGINVYTLWRVYNEKFNMLNKDKSKKMYADSLCKLNSSTDGSSGWTMDKLLCSHYCPCYFEQYNKPIFVRITDEEIEIYKALQNSLRAKAEKLGVYVEANPSSNTAIGDIDSIYSHPIINLNNSGLRLDKNNENCVMTTINSDDPLVFSTCVENEIAYIYYELLNEDCKRENVLGWIDKIRKHGIESSFVKYDATYQEMLDDFNEIMNYPIT